MASVHRSAIFRKPHVREIASLFASSRDFCCSVWFCAPLLLCNLRFCATSQGRLCYLCFHLCCVISWPFTKIRVPRTASLKYTCCPELQAYTLELRGLQEYLLVTLLVTTFTGLFKLLNSARMRSRCSLFDVSSWRSRLPLARLPLPRLPGPKIR